MRGGGPEDIWWGHQQFMNHLGGATKNSREKKGGYQNLMHINNETTTILNHEIHCSVNGVLN